MEDKELQEEIKSRLNYTLTDKICDNCVYCVVFKKSENIYFPSSSVPGDTVCQATGLIDVPVDRRAHCDRFIAVVK